MIKDFQISTKQKERVKLKRVWIYWCYGMFFSFLIVSKPLTLSARQSTKEKVLHVPPQESRSFMLTNSIGLFYYGETGLCNISKFQGLSYLTQEFLEDYFLEVGGNILERSQADAYLYIDSLKRVYRSPDITETASINDTLPVLMIKLQSNQPFPLAIAPVISGSKKPQDFVIHWSSEDKILYIARKNHLVKHQKKNYPVWIGISSFPLGEFSETGVDYLKENVEVFEQKTFIPGKINMYLNKYSYFFFLLGDSKKDILRMRNHILKTLNLEMKKREPQIEGVRKI